MVEAFKQLETLARTAKSRQCKRGPLTIEHRDEASKFANNFHYFWNDEEINRVTAIRRHAENVIS